MNYVYVVETHDGIDFIHTCVRSAIEKAISMIMAGEPTNTVEEYMEMMERDGYIHIRTTEYFTFYVSKKEVERPKNNELRKGHEVAKGMAAIKAYKDGELPYDFDLCYDIKTEAQLRILVEEKRSLEFSVEIKELLLSHSIALPKWLYAIIAELIENSIEKTTRTTKDIATIIAWRLEVDGEMIETANCKRTHYYYSRSSANQVIVQKHVNNLFEDLNSEMRVAFVDNRFIPWKEVK